MGNRAQRSLSPQTPAQSHGAKRPSHRAALGSVWREARVQDAGHQGLGVAARSPVCPREGEPET